MSNHLAMTYKPKIEAVRSGKCTQTIRRPRDIEVGNRVWVHGWEGVPYKTPWSFKKLCRITKIESLYFMGEDVYLYPRVTDSTPNVFDELVSINGWKRLSEADLDGIARKDYIDPPTGEELRRVLIGLNKYALSSLNGVLFYVITWEQDDIRWKHPEMAQYADNTRRPVSEGLTH